MEKLGTKEVLVVSKSLRTLNLLGAGIIFLLMTVTKTIGHFDYIEEYMRAGADKYPNFAGFNIEPNQVPVYSFHRYIELAFRNFASPESLLALLAVLAVVGLFVFSLLKKPNFAFGCSFVLPVAFVSSIMVASRYPGNFVDDKFHAGQQIDIGTFPKHIDFGAYGTPGNLVAIIVIIAVLLLLCSIFLWTKSYKEVVDLDRLKMEADRKEEEKQKRLELAKQFAAAKSTREDLKKAKAEKSAEKQKNKDKKKSKKNDKKVDEAVVEPAKEEVPATATETTAETNTETVSEETK